MSHFSFLPRLLSLSLAIVFIFPEAQAQSPSNIGGRTIELTVSDGTFPFATSGKFRFLPSAEDDSYAIVPISGDIEASSGTHSYTKTGGNTASLSLVDDMAGGLTADIIFNTSTSGTYSLTSTSFPEGKPVGHFYPFLWGFPCVYSRGDHNREHHQRGVSIRGFWFLQFSTCRNGKQL